jgi:hypothetical protein
MEQKIKHLDSKQIFLLLFSRELIRNSQEAISHLNEIIEEESKEKKSPQIEKPNAGTLVEPFGVKIKPKTEESPLEKSIMSEKPKAEIGGIEPEKIKVVKPAALIKTQRREISENPRVQQPILRVPEPKLPQEFQYLRPTPTRKEIDLDRLNPYVNDPGVKEIECESPNRPIVVSGMMGRLPTETILNSSEVEDIIERFAKASKIPVDIGIYKVVVGNLIFSAIVSEVVPSRFLITKMTPTNQTIIKPNPPLPPQKIPQQVMDYSSYIRK